MINQKGSVSFGGMLLTTLLSAGFLLNVLKLQETHISLIERAQVYICFKSQIVSIQKYVKKIGRLNKLLVILFGLQFAPYVGAKAKVLHRYIQQVQDILHVSYLKKVLTESRCYSSQSLMFIKNSPYFRVPKVKLDRNYDGSVKIKRKRWVARILKKTKSKEQGSKFMLKGKFQVKSHLSTKIKIETIEIPLRGFWN